MLTIMAGKPKHNYKKISPPEDSITERNYSSIKMITIMTMIMIMKTILLITLMMAITITIE